MAFEFYDYAAIKSAADCRVIARDLGLTVADDRCAATWRGGKNPESVSMNADGWHDFATEESGSVIDLVARVKFNGLIPHAQQWLGQHLGLTPTGTARQSPQHSRYQALLDDGYTETARYRYTDAAGVLVHQVARLEHPTKKKEFCQADAAGRWSVKGKDITLVLYNLPWVAVSDWVVIVEGEKDAETLIAWDIPATTNCGGAQKWEASYSDALAGKDVILCPDRDSAGALHVDQVGKSLVGKAKSIRLLTISKTQKDVTDWRDNEGGTAAKFMAAAKAAPQWIEPRDEEIALAEAKEANAQPLRNFKPTRVQVGNKTKIEREPRLIRPLVQDIHRRFLGFPRVLGSTLFDHDRTTGEIREIHNGDALFAWMQCRCNNVVEWTSGDPFITKRELFNALRDAARRYESISDVPDWPVRHDVYYAHPPLPPPTLTHSAFDGLVDMFSPASPEYRVLLKALICAPLFYRPGIPRPMWVIDSEDGAGTGKTTIAEVVAELYGSEPIQCGKHDLFRGMDELIKRIVSTAGRRKRVLMLDNITGLFKSEELSALITRKSISGKAPYGRGEETRPNNLTYIITANSANLDHDLAIRSFFVYVQRAQISAQWKSDVMRYVESRRMAIFSDIIDIISKPVKADPLTRFPEFEVEFLRPMCADADEFGRVISRIKEDQKQSNFEDDLGKQIEEMIIEKLTELEIDDPENTSVFIQSQIAQEWLSTIVTHDTRQILTVQDVRNMGKNGLIRIDASIPRYPATKKQRRSGLMWRPNVDRKAIIAIGGTPKHPKKIILMDVA